MRSSDRNVRIAENRKMTVRTAEKTADATDAEMRTAEIITVARIIVTAITEMRTVATIVGIITATEKTAMRIAIVKTARIVVVTTAIEMRTAGTTTVVTDAAKTARRAERNR